MISAPILTWHVDSEHLKVRSSALLKWCRCFFNEDLLRGFLPLGMTTVCESDFPAVERWRQSSTWINVLCFLLGCSYTACYDFDMKGNPNQTRQCADLENPRRHKQCLPCDIGTASYIGSSGHLVYFTLWKFLPMFFSLKQWRRQGGISRSQPTSHRRAARHRLVQRDCHTFPQTHAWPHPKTKSSLRHWFKDVLWKFSWPQSEMVVEGKRRDAMSVVGLSFS